MIALDLEGNARVAEVKGKKEGAGAAKELVMRVRLHLVTDADVCAFFDPALRALLFNPNTASPRFENLRPLKFSGAQRNMELVLEEIMLPAVELSDFVLSPLEGERVTMTFVAKCFPQDSQVTAAMRHLGNDITFAVRSNGNLIDEPQGAKRYKTAAPERAEKPDPTKAKNADLPLESAPLGEWPGANRRGEYKDTTAEKVTFSEPGAQCHIALLQVGAAAWVNGVMLDLDGEEPFIQALRATKNPFEARSLALMDAALFVQTECAEWAKTHKRSPAKADVANLGAWAGKILIGSEPASPVKAKPQVAHKRARKAAK